MKLSDMIKDIQETIDMFGDYKLEGSRITTDDADITIERTNQFYMTVDEENKTVQVNLMS